MGANSATTEGGMRARRTTVGTRMSASHRSSRAGRAGLDPRDGENALTTRSYMHAGRSIIISFSAVDSCSCTTFLYLHPVVKSQSSTTKRELGSKNRSSRERRGRASGRTGRGSNHGVDRVGHAAKALDTSGLVILRRLCRLQRTRVLSIVACGWLRNRSSVDNDGLLGVSSQLSFKLPDLLLELSDASLRLTCSLKSLIAFEKELGVVWLANTLLVNLLSQRGVESVGVLEGAIELGGLVVLLFELMLKVVNHSILGVLLSQQLLDLSL